jgi:hypothetical protein
VSEAERVPWFEVDINAALAGWRSLSPSDSDAKKTERHQLNE